MLRLQTAVITIICACILVTDVNRIRHRVTGDFQHFYYAADAMRHGMDPYAAWTRGYIYPPLIAFVFQPLSYLGIDRAAALMLAVNVAVTLLSVALAADEFLRRFNTPRSPIAITTVMILAMLLNIDKIKGEWQMWQTDVFMLLLFVLSLRTHERFPFVAGIFLGLAVNIKYLPVMFLPYLLIRRQWRLTAGLVGGIVIFALLPAFSTGWRSNCRNWVTATNGLLQMADVPSTKREAAEIHDVKDSLSCSITSAIARSIGPALGFILAGITAHAVILISTWIYHRRGRSIFATQNLAVTGAEWVMLVTAVLVFGPQTNTRHLFDALIFTTAASVLLLFPRPDDSVKQSKPVCEAHIQKCSSLSSSASPRLCGSNSSSFAGTTRRYLANRLQLLIGTAIVFFGFILPPGSRTVIGELTPTVRWLRAGGPCWCLLIGSVTLLSTVVREHPENAADTGKLNN